MPARFWTLLTVCMAALPAQGHTADFITQSADGTIRISGSVGLANLWADELVFDENGKRLSRLIWESNAVKIVTGTLDVELPKEWQLRLTASAGFDGDGHMRDYDWIPPFAEPGSGMDAWSDRSIHRDTRLDHYFRIEGEIGRAVYDNGTASFGLGGGLRYTDVKWSAYGGTYAYSVDSFRDSRGVFRDGEPSISYRQQLPVPYAALNGSQRLGDWVFTGALQGGFTLGARGVDDHWQRSLHFVDRFEATPVVTANIEAGYSLTPQTLFYVGAAFEKMFEADADSSATYVPTGEQETYDDGGGGAFRSMSVSVGLKGRF